MPTDRRAFTLTDAIRLSLIVGSAGALVWVLVMTVLTPTNSAPLFVGVLAFLIALLTPEAAGHAEQEQFKQFGSWVKDSAYGHSRAYHSPLSELETTELNPEPDPEPEPPDEDLRAVYDEPDFMIPAATRDPETAFDAKISRELEDHD